MRKKIKEIKIWFCCLSWNQALLARQCLVKRKRQRPLHFHGRREKSVLHSQRTQWKRTAQILYSFKTAHFPQSFSNAMHWLLCFILSRMSPLDLTVLSHTSFFSVCRSSGLPILCSCLVARYRKGRSYGKTCTACNLLIMDLVKQYWFQWIFSQIPYTAACMHPKLVSVLLYLSETSDFN